ncbi:MAG TPA: S41 family peptidase [Thermoanaerobaculia bacterium]|nr:S41 family peptidase [Thermoanaerobaculia bacterium]
MKSNRSRLAFVLVSLAALFLLTALKGPVLAPGRDPVLKPLAIFTEVLNLTRSNYVEPVDVSTLLAGAYDGVTDAIDPFSYYVSGDRMSRYRAFEASRPLDSGLVLGRRGGFAYVVAPVPGSPADAAGIKSGDVILAIEGTPTRNQALWEIESSIAGPEGSAVALKVLRGGDEREVTVRLVRKPYTPSAVSQKAQDQVPVIRIPYFAPGTAAAVEKALRSEPRAGAVIVDVRDSAGGDVDEAVRTASLFIPAGPVARLSGKKIPARDYATTGSRVWSGKTIVLIDGGTGGAPEIFAGALHDRAAADLVGEPTAGMGIVQRLLPMSSGGALYLTVGEYVSPSGTELTGKGLRPTSRVDLFPDDTPGDAILKKAVEIAHGAPAKAAA